MTFRDARETNANQHGKDGRKYGGMFLEWNPTWIKMDSTKQMDRRPESGLRDTKDDIQHHPITERPRTGKTPQRESTPVMRTGWDPAQGTF